MNSRPALLTAVIFTAGCSFELSPIPPNARPSERQSIALLKPLAENMSWHATGSVREINLVGDDVTDTHVAALRDFTQLECLGLAGSKISDESLKEIAGFPALTALDLQYTAVTDDGFRHLSASPSLELIVLTGTQITDVGFAHLAAIRTLNSVFAEKTSITEIPPPALQSRRDDRL